MTVTVRVDLRDVEVEVEESEVLEGMSTDDLVDFIKNDLGWDEVLGHCSTTSLVSAAVEGDSAEAVLQELDAADIMAHVKEQDMVANALTVDERKELIQRLIGDSAGLSLEAEQLTLRAFTEELVGGASALPDPAEDMEPTYAALDRYNATQQRSIVNHLLARLNPGLGESGMALELLRLIQTYGKAEVAGKVVELALKS